MQLCMGVLLSSYMEMIVYEFKAVNGNVGVALSQYKEVSCY